MCKGYFLTIHKNVDFLLKLLIFYILYDAQLNIMDDV